MHVLEHLGGVIMDSLRPVDTENWRCWNCLWLIWACSRHHSNIVKIPVDSFIGQLKVIGRCFELYGQI